MNRLKAEVWLRTKLRTWIMKHARVVKSFGDDFVVWPGDRPPSVRGRVDAIAEEACNTTDNEIWMSLDDLCECVFTSGYEPSVRSIEEAFMVYAMMLTLVEYADDEILCDDTLRAIDLLSEDDDRCA